MNIEDENVLNDDEQFEKDKREGYYEPDQSAESDAETQRKGLAAYGALSTLIGAIIVFIIIGLLMDYKFQTSPWGIVSGVLIGSIIGFYQFMRISSK